MFSQLIHLNNNVSFLNLCCNNREQNITCRTFVFTRTEATILCMNRNVLKASKNYTNKLVSLTTSNNSKILLRLLWFILTKFHWKKSYISHYTITSQKTKCSKITMYVYQRFRCEQEKLLTVELELPNLSARQLNTEINHGY